MHCYDRRQRRLHSPFARLPHGLDHANAAYMPAGTCGADEPARVLLLNYRVDHYANYRAEVLAHGRTPDGRVGAGATRWNIFAAPVSRGYTDRRRSARDAPGLVSSGGGRYLLDIGGLHFRNSTRDANGNREKDLWVLDSARVLTCASASGAWKASWGCPCLPCRRVHPRRSA